MTLQGTSRILGLYCITSAVESQYGVPNSGISTFSYPAYQSGMLLYLWTAVVTIYWWWPDGIGVLYGDWWCGGPTYAVPYFCPFDAIQCLQPITLPQLAYTVDMSYLPTGATAPPACSGFPSTITITPA